MMKPLIEENEMLRNKVLELNRKVEFLDLATRKNNFIIHGLPETNNEKDERLDNHCPGNYRKTGYTTGKGRNR